MLTNLKILSISPFIVEPFIHGAVTRIYYLNQTLAETNQVFLAYRQSEATPEVESFAQLLPNGTSRIEQILSPRFLQQALNIIQKNKIDLILANHIWSGLHAIILSKLSGVPFIFDNHNVEYIRFKRMGNPAWPLIWVLERFICQNAKTVLCVSNVDKTSIEKNLYIAGSKIQVIENGVDTQTLLIPLKNRAEYRQKLGIDEGKLFLFFGSYTYPPNKEAVNIIVQEIYPRLKHAGQKGKILLAGNGFDALAKELPQARNEELEIKYIGFVEDLHTLIKSADVLIAPLMAGSGTRFKILETLACGVPVVTTTIGAEGLDIAVCGSNLAVVDQWPLFVETAIKKVQYPSEPLSTTFLEQYDWRSIVAKITL